MQQVTSKCNIQHLIVKICSICNLSCDYCYVFNKADKSHQIEPDVMSMEVVEMLLFRIDELFSETKQKHLHITFHGGEPLLAGEDFFTSFIDKYRAIVRNGEISFGLQTNGTLLNEKWCKLLDKLNIHFGVSIDGDRSACKYRKYKNGLEAFDSIIQGYKHALQCDITPPILSVINTQQSPNTFYNSLKSLNANYIDCLLPDATYETYNAEYRGIGLWLIQLFDIWFADKSRLRIRLFEAIVHLLLDSSSPVGGEMFGNTLNGVLDIRPDGIIDIPDTLRICDVHFLESRYSIFINKLIDITSEKIYKKYYFSHKDQYLSVQCNNCIVKGVCGGGLLAHRFSKEREFDNPSVYCFDLFLLIKHVQNKIFGEMDADNVDLIAVSDFNNWR